MVIKKDKFRQGWGTFDPNKDMNINIDHPFKTTIWKPIKGFLGKYQVNDLGAVMSLKHNKILKQTLNKNNGLLFVTLRLDGMMYIKYVHRLVAVSFIDKGWDINLNTVVHKDNDSLNNKAINLEWISRKEAFERLKQDGVVLGRPSKRVIQLSYWEGEVFGRFESVSNAAESLGLLQGNISDVCHHKKRSAGGYRFMFEFEWLAHQLND